MKVGGPLVWGAMVRLVERVDPALDQIGRTLPEDFPPRTWDTISQGMRAQAARFLGSLVEALEDFEPGARLEREQPAPQVRAAIEPRR